MRGVILFLSLVVGSCAAICIMIPAVNSSRPGSVRFECADGTHGTMYVEDVDHPIPELTAKIVGLRGSLYDVPGLKITGELPKVIVIKATPVE